MKPTQINSAHDKPDPRFRGDRLKEIFSSLIFYLSILTFIIGFNFSDTMLNGWTQQFMPNINNRPISDITFLDSLTGFAVTPYTANDTAYILKTTNGGDNWNIVFRGSTNVINGFNRVQFINQNTGFCASGAGIFKTINAGLNWSLITNQVYARDMFVLSQDTIWTVDEEGTTGGVFFTSNGGSSWTRQLFIGANNPDRIYMYNARIGFVARSSGNSLYRTMNGGDNWTLIANNEGFNDMFFVDSSVGWKAGPMKKTTNGGLNWVTQTMPSGGNILTSGIGEFSNINRDTIWGGGSGVYRFPNNQLREMLYRTVNGGDTWFFQIPDTTIFIDYKYCDFVNKLNGWFYSSASTGIHTTTGGDTVWYTGIQQLANAVPEKFTLKQNYPNPFNPRTVIPYSISSSAQVKIIAYDIQGREVQRMVDNYLQAGAYEVDFMCKFTATGVYFYKMTVTDDKSKIVYTDTKKMILLK